MTTLSQLGEDAVLHRLLPLLTANPALLVGAGDDCAVTARDNRWDSLLKTDAVVEGVHFTRDTAPERIGRKALARAVSDMAAMGGIPEHALVTVMVHPSRTPELLEGIYRGLAALAAQFNISLAGGETTALPQDGLAVSVALTGRVEHGRAVLRSTAKAGDIICVSGRLGGSFESGRHLDFTPRVELARFLMEHGPRPSAMMDLSDGLGTDLPRLAAASRCGFEVDETRLPLHEGCTARQGICDGEDYELLLCFPPQLFERVKGTPLPTPVSAIGKLTGKPAQTLPTGWLHFTR